MSRIQLGDNTLAVLDKMTEGNPGAIDVCLQIFDRGEEIDPQSALGGLGKIMKLDTFEIYGSRIWMLYKDCCQQDIGFVIAVLRVVQLGGKPARWLHEHIDESKPFDAEEVKAFLDEKLPTFRTDQCESLR